MNGDFSKWELELENMTGVLQQQGRVLLDQDWNSQTLINSRWQETAARDVIGPSVVAAPSDAPHGFRVEKAVRVGNEVTLFMRTGHAWNDGQLIRLPARVVQETAVNGATVKRVVPEALTDGMYVDRVADRFGAGAPANGTKDAVVLETWREEMNSFQVSTALIEPALGGPDTAELVHTAMAFRLVNLVDSEDCRDAVSKLEADYANRGSLTATLEPTQVTASDCPVADAGGYSGFEHNLYRVEIAKVSGATDKFKWSQFNGGLVGKGQCDVTKGVEITANYAAISSSGLTAFYMEVVEYDEPRGRWRITYGAEVTLNGDLLEIGTEHYTETALPQGEVFFRLWNAIDDVASYPVVNGVATPTHLNDGVQLQFIPPNGKRFSPGDYWTFEVRAGDMPNDPLLVDNAAPQGPVYHCAGLAEITWADDEATLQDLEIEDCRRVIRPVTSRASCCVYHVGDGVNSHGDFDSIAEAVRHLPPEGGEICVLPGMHRGGVTIKNLNNVTIRGCGKETSVIPDAPSLDATGAPVLSPVFSIVDSECIQISNLDIVSFDGVAVYMKGSEVGKLTDIEVFGNRIIACQAGIYMRDGVDVNIHHNRVRVLDKAEGGVGIMLSGTSCVAERNEVTVIPASETVPPTDDDGDHGGGDPSDPCAPLKVFYNPTNFYHVTQLIWTFTFTTVTEVAPYQAIGGIQVADGSEAINVRDNWIQGGAGNGVTLGGVADLDVVIDGDGDDDGLEHPVNIDAAVIFGNVLYNESTPDVFDLVFTPDVGTAKVLTTNGVDDNRSFQIKTGVFPGATQVAVSLGTPEYRITEVVESRVDYGIDLQITVEPVEDATVTMPAFMRDLTLLSNDIRGMGLSGVGIPLDVNQGDDTDGLKALLAMVGTPVVGLSIRRNRITGCVRNPLDELLAETTQERGIGGIALGLCTDVEIHDNEIVGNGKNSRVPVCGVYIKFVEYLHVSANDVLGNGAATSSGEEVQPGKRGGIMAFVSSLSLLNLFGGKSAQATFMRPAARIHDNEVNQPIGQALTLAAIGPVAVSDNQFETQMSGNGSLDKMAGAVFIINLGGFGSASPSKVTSSFASTGKTSEGPGVAPASDSGAGGATPGAAPQMKAKAYEANKFQNPAYFISAIGGNTLYTDNQTRLHNSDDTSGAQVIISMDDVGYGDNQSDCLQRERNDLKFNTAVFAETLRVASSRFREPYITSAGLPLSLLSYASAKNRTNDCQSDRIVFALGGTTADSNGNQAG